MAAPKISLKLFFDTKTHKVIFAEAGKDFVDFLFHLLSLPVGTILRLLTDQTLVGCIGNLFQSIENLSEAYMQPNQNKELLLNPTAPDSMAYVSLLLPDNMMSPTVRKFYNCTNSHQYVTSNLGVDCPACRVSMSATVEYVTPANVNLSSSVEGGFVKGFITYIVTDDLLVMPISLITSISILKKCNLLEVDTLEEKMVEFGINEVPKLLKASLQSKAALTYVFLGAKVIKESQETSAP